VTFIWEGQNGSSCATCSAPMSLDSIDNAIPGNHSALWYGLPADGVNINAKTSISKFWFEIQEGGKTTIEDQGSVGFPLQTQVMLSNTSCMQSNFATAQIDILVRTVLCRSILCAHSTNQIMLCRYLRTPTSRAFSLKATLRMQTSSLAQARPLCTMLI
jgi:hypothetical protein